MRLLFVGDVVGGLGRRTLAAVLPGLIDRHQPDFVVAKLVHKMIGYYSLSKRRS